MEAFLDTVWLGPAQPTCYPSAIMPDFRAYCVTDKKDFTEIRLDADESHHLVVVNRCGRGDPVVLFDGLGNEWICECLDPSRNGAVLRVRESRQSPPRPRKITLGQALPKGSTMDDIIRQATEIGTTRIVPLLSERTQVHLDGDREGKKLEKWRTTAIEAAKQCCNPWLPEITTFQNATAFMQSAKGYDLMLIASLCPGTSTLKSALAHHRARHGGAPQNVLWLVGPEGDFSPAELTAAITAGFQPITLGPLVLRSDTAAVYALSILSYELGNS
jgi:16S rRNA (uracil1498-N3)-methyltransferase